MVGFEIGCIAHELGDQYPDHQRKGRCEQAEQPFQYFRHMRGIFSQERLDKKNEKNNCCHDKPLYEQFFPGSITYSEMGFREIIPGLGAFQIRPSENEDNGSKELEKFFTDVISHFLNRASQRENAAFRQYAIHKNKPIDEDRVDEPIPEEYGLNRIIPDETYVLIAYCKSEDHLQWIRNNGLYNSRIGKHPEDITLNQKEAGASFILLHLEGTTKSAEIYKLKQNSLETLTRQDLLDKNYPSPRADFYLGYKLENDVREGFGNLTWDISKLIENGKTRKLRKPFAVSISELMKAKTTVI
jgi:hypothetical protein